MSNFVIFICGFSGGFAVAVLMLYKMKNNTTPFKSIVSQLTPQVKHKAYVPNKDLDY